MAPPRSFIWTRADRAHAADDLRAAARLRDGQQLAEAAAGRDRHVPLDPVARITISPYIQMWRTVPLARYFVNSLIVCTCAAVLSVADRDVRRVRGQPLPVPRPPGVHAGRAVHPDVPRDLVPAPAVPDLRVDRERDRDHAARLAHRACHHLPDVLAAVLHLAAGRLFRLDSARSRRSGPRSTAAVRCAPCSAW